jgi:hypothetical protein
MNRTERAYAQRLELLWRAGEIAWWAYEPFLIALADGLKYRPDFVVVRKGEVDGSVHLEVHETKGTPRGRRLGEAKVKMAATIYPWIAFFILEAERDARRRIVSWRSRRVEANSRPGRVGTNAGTFTPGVNRLTPPNPSDDRIIEDHRDSRPA